MTNQELLELAAKAAGYPLEWKGDIKIITDDGERKWNPLTNDGDALRLAVKLRLAVNSPHEGYRAFAQSQDRQHGVHANCGESGLDESDPLAATRRAIVRAAAEIGKGIP